MGNPWVKRLLPLVIVIVAVLLGRSLMIFKPSLPHRDKAQVSTYVDVQVVHLRSLPMSVNSQGTVTAKRNIEWASKVSGRVIWVAPEFAEGAAVAAGTTLLKLDAIDYRVMVAEAEASLADANLALTEERNELRRGNSYRADNQQDAKANLRQPKLAQVESKVNAAKERLLQAQADLEATEVKAPFAAIIDNKQVDLGQYVSAGSPLFSLLSTDVAEVRLPITSTDIQFITAAKKPDGQLPTVILSSNFGRHQQQWHGQLVRIERRVDADTRTFFAVAAVDQPYAASHGVALSTGLFVDAVIEGITIDNASRIPHSALHDETYVYLVIDGQLTRRAVTVLRRERESVVISSGLDDGDKLVLNKLDLMVEGMSVIANVSPSASAIQ